MQTITQAIAAAQSNDLGALIDAHDFALQLGYQAQADRADMPAEFMGVSLLSQGFVSGFSLAAQGHPVNLAPVFLS